MGSRLCISYMIINLWFFINSSCLIDKQWNIFSCIQKCCLGDWYWYCLFGWIFFLFFLLQIWNVIRQSKLEHSEGFLDLLSLRFYVYIKMCFSASSAIHNKTPAHAATTSKRTKTPKTTNQKGKTAFTVTTW